MYKVIIKTDKPIQDMDMALYHVTNLPKKEWSAGTYTYCSRTLHSWDSAKTLLNKTARQCKIYGIEIRNFSVRKNPFYVFGTMIAGRQVKYKAKKETVELP